MFIIPNCRNDVGNNGVHNHYGILLSYRLRIQVPCVERITQHRVNRCFFSANTRRAKMAEMSDRLYDTVSGMVSSDYKKRFISEYEQLVIRYSKLKAMLANWDDGTIEFMPKCPRRIYDFQIRTMEDYIMVLESRAVMEDIKLPGR